MAERLPPIWALQPPDKDQTHFRSVCPTNTAPGPVVRGAGERMNEQNDFTRLFKRLDPRDGAHRAAWRAQHRRSRGAHVPRGEQTMCGSHGSGLGGARRGRPALISFDPPGGRPDAKEPGSSCSSCGRRRHRPAHRKMGLRATPQETEPWVPGRKAWNEVHSIIDYPKFNLDL